MHLGNTSQNYGMISKTQHWLMALLVLTIIPLGIAAHNMAHQLEAGGLTPGAVDAHLARTAFLFSLHKTLGVLIFFLAIVRIAWMVSQPKPALLNADRRLEALLAETVHWLLYGSLVLVPLTGWVHHSATTGFAPIRWPFGQSLPFVPKNAELADLFASLHIVFERVLVLAILLHVAGALKHHFLDRDMTLRRMWFGKDISTAVVERRHALTPLVAALAVWCAALAIGGLMDLYNHESATTRSDPQRIESEWSVTEGTLGIEITQMGERVQGGFGDWSAAIRFDETVDHGNAGEVRVTIGIASLTLGNVTRQALGPGFFVVGEYPSATFTGQIRRTETGYIATGPLEIKGKTVQLSLPFGLEVAGDTARMTGEVNVDRRDFGIGADYSDESALGFSVGIRVELSATRSDR